jgi:catalase
MKSCEKNISKLSQGNGGPISHKGWIKKQSAIMSWLIVTFICKHLEVLMMGKDENFEDLAERIQRMQDKARKIAQQKDPSKALKRGFHAKGMGVRAKFKVRSDLPEQLRVGLFQAGVVYDALVRFSNARGEVLGDLAKDQRGIAIRLKPTPGENLSPEDNSNVQDFLMTNTPVSFARNPDQFIEVGEILLDGTRTVIPNLVKKYGFTEARRILGVFLAPLISFRPLQMNQYWSRTSYRFGDFPVRYLIRPIDGSEIWSTTRQVTEVLRSLRHDASQRESYMRTKLQDALRNGEVCFDFCIQHFVDEKKTPVEDAYIEWKEKDAPPVPIAMLVLPKQELDDRLQQEVEQMAFSPWNTKDFTPLGRINLAREKVYSASAGHRGANLGAGN